VLAERHRERERLRRRLQAEHINARRRERLQECPELRERRIMAKRDARYRQGAQPQELRMVWAAIRRSGRCPTVTQLVDAEQRRYWREHSSAHRAYRAECEQQRWRWRYMTNPALRRYHQEKARRRKARERGNHVVRVTTTQIRERFEQFAHCCAYCGAATSRLQTEHFLPISKGGTHVLSNVLPACKPCNHSKFNHDPETWYRAQPFFTEQRWRTILRVLGKQRVPVDQLSLV
jgi:5-methylcytosine-specific restriction endonuclease McrA